MAKPKPFSEEELAYKKKRHTDVYKEDDDCRTCRFLATIAEYKAAMDSAMRQVNSLNQGNITDRKRIEKLKKFASEYIDKYTKAKKGAILKNLELEEKIETQAATIKQLEEILEEEGYRFPEKEACQAIGKEEKNG